MKFDVKSNLRGEFKPYVKDIKGAKEFAPIQFLSEEEARNYCDFWASLNVGVNKLEDVVFPKTR